MSLIERLPPGQVLARVSFDDCLLAKPRRPMPRDLAAWARALPVPKPLEEMGLARPLRDAVAPLWAAMLARYRQGLRIEAGEHARVVVHCDTVRYEFDTLGRVHARMPKIGGGYEWINVEVGTPFPSWHWVRLLAEREPEALAPLRHSIHVRRLAGMVPGTGEADDVERQALAWLCDVIEGLARRCIDGLKMRSHLRQALGVDPALLSVARRARPRQCVGDVGNQWWNRCVAYRELLLEVGPKAPGLLPVVGELVWAGKISPQLRNVSALRETINMHLTAADWNRLRNESARPLWSMWRENRIRSLASLTEFMACWAPLHRGLPPGLRVPRAMFEPLARTLTSPTANHVLPPVRWPGTPSATRQSVEAYVLARSRGEGPRFIEEQWAPVVRWAADYTDRGRPAVRHWPSLRRLAAQDERRLRAELSGKAWPNPLPRFESGGLTAVALCTGTALADEAIAMRHCADRFAPDCAEGRLLVYSLRDQASGIRLATASFALNGDLAVLTDVTRSLNRQPAPDEVAFAGQLASALLKRLKAEAMAKKQLVLPIPPAEAKAIYMERKDSDVFAVIQPTPTGLRGYKVMPSGAFKEISGPEAVEPLNPWSWSPMSREDFIKAVSALTAAGKP